MKRLVAEGRRILPVFTLLLAPAIPSGALTSPNLTSDVKIRVRIAEAVPSVAVRGFDLQIFQEVPLPTLGKAPRKGRALANVADQVSEWTFRCQGDRIRAFTHPGKAALDLRPPVIIQSPAGFLSFRGRPYREVIQIYSVGSLCEVINEVDLEKYLEGLVNAEFSSKWNKEAVAAQVIAARTYAFYQIWQSRTQHFDVDSTVRDQVYDGSIREDLLASREVERTRGMLLTVGREARPAPLKAFYHSTCAGKTELPENVWGQRLNGFYKTVSCPFCTRSPRFHWRLDLTSQEIADAFRKGIRGSGLPSGWPSAASSILQSGQLIDLKISSWDVSGRVARVGTTWIRGVQRFELELSAPQFREWLSGDRFKSTSFVLFSQSHGSKTVWKFEGKGNGHGVGMCQWGAKVMGEKGFTLSAILKRYYPNAILRKLW